MPNVMMAVYDELRRIAANQLRHERVGHTLQTTALVNEAYVRLSKREGHKWSSKADFCAAAAQAIRRVLIDHARARRAAKRGGPDAQRVELDGTVLAMPKSNVDLLDLDGALRRLAALSERQARVVELRFFGGLSEEETALAMGVSRRTVQNDWRGARAWLRRELGGSSPPASDSTVTA
ncbi:MAG: sigma-70 family RNA polymerase sigma factor [Phycisphaerae bacterium]|nr:sigma-70 family RNA polymerase sigma factor [Phycisphaerae bacterium]